MSTQACLDFSSPPPAETVAARNTKMDAVNALKVLRGFIGPFQLHAVGHGCRGEEKQFFFDKLVELAHTVATMPQTYEQDGKGENAVAYPLAAVQRLGYLDECDFIACSKDLGMAVATPSLQSRHTVPCFKADHAYPLRSTTVAVKRSGTKLNLCGELDDVEWDGQELAFYITDETGTEKVFMEARLRAENIKLSILKPGAKPVKQDHDCAEACVIDFTLQALTQHFIIPEVPDVARVSPEGYQHNLALVQEIESLCP
jgi:hypothetical protein